MNSTISLMELFNNGVFYIPQYQRAYAWDEKPQLEAFVEDLRLQMLAQKQQHDTVAHDESGVSERGQQKQYFLGTLLLHEIGKNPQRFDIVDGQQRLTTAVVFFATGLAVINENGITDKKFCMPLKRAFIYNDDIETQKFHTITEDDPFFAKDILGIGAPSSTTGDSPSMRKLMAAKEYFIRTIDKNDWPKLIEVLMTSQVITYIVDNPADATQIFELQNDRGKRLTDLEALKSYLMHTIYLNSKNPGDPLNKVQTVFAKIYRTIEELSKYHQAPDSEDSILSYHCVGYLDWKTNEWRDPKPLVKSAIALIPVDRKTQWVLDFTVSVLHSYTSVLEIVRSLDEYPELNELFVLNRMASFWPLLIKAWNYDTDKEKKSVLNICRLLEVFAFKGYSIAGVRSDTGASYLRNWTKTFNGNFETLFEKCFSLSLWWDIPSRFQKNLDSPNFYHFNKSDVRYFFWRYENSLRSITGQHQPLLTWKDFISQDPKKKLSIEHISPQTAEVNDEIITWPGYESVKFEKGALHRLGNLVLDTASLNSAKGNKDIWEKLKHTDFKSALLSEKEIRKWAAESHDGGLAWTLDSIKERHKTLTYFATDTWDASKYYSGTVLSQEEQDTTSEAE